MFTAPASPEEHRQIRDQYTRYKTCLIITVAVTFSLSLGMIMTDMLLLALFFISIAAYGSMLLLNMVKTLKVEMDEAMIVVYQGTVEKKNQHTTYLKTKKHLIFVDGENHKVPSEFFSGVDEGDTIELHFTRYTKFLTFMRLLCRKDTQLQQLSPSSSIDQKAYSPPPPAVVLYAQPADLEGYDHQYDAYSRRGSPDSIRGTLSPGVSYDDPTVAVMLCPKCSFPLDSVTGNCDKCSPHSSQRRLSK
jgi:hypothetical protein